VLAVALPAPAAGIAFNVVQLATLLVSVAVLGRLHPAHRRAWTLIVAGRALWTAASLYWSAVEAGSGSPPYPSWVGVLFLLQYPLVAAGFAGLARGRPAPRGARRGLAVDAALVTGAAAIGGWLLVIDPLLRGSSAGGPELGTALAYVMLDLLLVAAVLRLVGFGGRTPESHLVLGAGAVALVAADFAYLAGVLGSRHTVFTASRTADLLWLLWAVAVAAAATAEARGRGPIAEAPGGGAAAEVPGRGAAAEMPGRGPAGSDPAAPAGAGVSPRRLVIFAGLALLVPLAPTLVHGSPPAALVPAGLGALVALLLVVRLAMLAALVGRTTEALEYARAQREALRDELRHRASHDPLTGLASRAALTTHLTRPARRQRENLILIDLDGFADINDAHGHPVGDDLLQEVARRLRTALRGARLLARLDGDEFAVLHRGDGAVAARRAIAALRPSYRVGDRELHLTASAGVVEIRTGRDAAHALRDADLALDAAKSAGRDRVVTFRPELREALLRRSELADSLRRAVDRGELDLAYQPVVHLTTGRVFAAEALMRWRRGGESVPPAQFIPLAEQTGLIVPMGWWALRSAVARARDWHGRYGVAVTVNVSAHQLREDDFVERVLATLDEAGLPGAGLILELTESTLVTDFEATDQALHRLRSHGVRVAVDDFGTGYSSLSYLMALPVDILKLDRAFVAAEGRQRAITGAVLQLAAGLDLTTIAEGVETAAQAAALRAMGCPLAQGFRYSPPVPPAAVEALLARWNPTLTAAT
jgi:diguanylate cyclase (GGDEF)-like protein